MRLGLFFVGVLFGFSTVAQAKIEGVYMVPASDSLANNVLVDLQKARFRVGRRDRVKFDYRIPKELAGPNAPRFVIVGTLSGAQPWVLSGKGVTASCVEAPGDQIDCTMFYEKVPSREDAGMIFDIDTAAAARYIDTLGLSAVRVSELKAAGTALRDEAIGIVSIKSK